jgi:hypothetical protein
VPENLELTVHHCIPSVPDLLCLNFVVVRAYLGAVANEFICNQWERKGMNADIYCSGGCNTCHSEVTISLLYVFFRVVPRRLQFKC